MKLLLGFALLFASCSPMRVAPYSAALNGYYRPPPPVAYYSPPPNYMQYYGSPRMTCYSLGPYLQCR